MGAILNFPTYMKDQARWMIRHPGKLPLSAHESKPFDYEPPNGLTDATVTQWRYRWNVPAVWSTYEAAKSVLERDDSLEGLCYVLHPAGHDGDIIRLICLDFDGCYDEDGNLDPAVAAILEDLDGFVEYSRSRRGLHLFVLVRTRPFTNIRGAAIGGCKVDVLCNAQVAVTGDVLFDNLIEISFEELNDLPFFTFKEVVDESDHNDLWDDDADGIDPSHEYLIDVMENWPTAVSGEHGQQKLFAAACRVLQHGVNGHEAELLLELMPADPPFSQADIRRTIQCAVPHVLADGSIDTLSQDDIKWGEPGSDDGDEDEFEVVEVEKITGNYGFDPVPVRELMRKDLKLEYIVEGAFVGEGSMFIGGREKCFKTGVAVDLLISLATGRPFLGEFKVNRRIRSTLFTAEIGMPSAQNLFQRIATSKDIDPLDLDGIDIVDTIPTFTIDKRTGQPVCIEAIRGLKRYLDEKRPDAVIFDPLYFAMGGSGVGDMYEIGAVLKNISELCKAYGVWAIYCHHAKKGSAEDEGRPMQLTDLYGAGVGAYARQWVLLSHAEPFRNGVANLFMGIGGSAQGDRGTWKLTIDEGIPDDILGRGWDVCTSKDEDAAAGELSNVAIEETIATLEGPDRRNKANIKDIRFMLNNPSQAALENKLRDMVKGGILTMLPGKNFERREHF